MKKSIVVLLISAYSILTYAQKDTVFTIQEKSWYDNTRKLCNLIRQNDTINLHQDSLFKNFIRFDYVLADDDTTRVRRRRVAFDTFFVHIKKFALKKDFEDYEMKPLRLCEGTELYKTFGYEEKEFLTDDQSYRTRKIESIPYIMVYYNKKKPDELLGTLLFSSSDNKIVSWVRINQGGYFYYLTFNMI